MDKEAIPRWDKDQIERDIMVYQHYKAVRLIEHITLFGLGVIFGIAVSYAVPLLWRMIGG